MSPFPTWFVVVFVVLLIVAHVTHFLPQSFQSKKPSMHMFDLVQLLWLISILFICPSKSSIQIANSSSYTVLEDVEVIFTEGQHIDFGDIQPHSTRIRRSPVGEGKQYQILFTYDNERRITEPFKAHSKGAVSPLRSLWWVYPDGDETK